MNAAALPAPLHLRFLSGQTLSGAQVSRPLLLLATKNLTLPLARPTKSSLPSSLPTLLPSSPVQVAQQPLGSLLRAWRKD